MLRPFPTHSASLSRRTLDVLTSKAVPPFGRSLASSCSVGPPLGNPQRDLVSSVQSRRTDDWPPLLDAVAGQSGAQGLARIRSIRYD